MITNVAYLLRRIGVAYTEYFTLRRQHDYEVEAKDTSFSRCLSTAHSQKMIIRPPFHIQFVCLITPRPVPEVRVKHVRVSGTTNTNKDPAPIVLKPMHCRMKRLVFCPLSICFVCCWYSESFQLGCSLHSATTGGGISLRNVSITRRNKDTIRSAWKSLDATETTKTLSTARFVAIQSLVRATISKPSISQMEQNAGFQQLSFRDKAFCRLMVTTVERRRGQVNAILDHCKEKKGDRSKKKRIGDRIVHTTLQVGLVQLLYINTTDFAAVKETVEALKQYRNAVSEKQIGYVNAILRRVSREAETFRSDSYANIQLNAAPWLIAELNRDWGELATHHIIERAMTESPRTLTVRGQSEKDVENVASMFEKAVVLPQRSVRVNKPPHGSLTGWPMFAEGLWWCQDPSATLPALALQSSAKQVIEDSPRVLDMCAAPGGKTAQLMNMGFRVTAVEISEKRVGKLQQNLSRLGFKNLEIVAANAANWTSDSPFDFVLLDAPCSATGTASKRPDVLWKSPHVVNELLNTQYALLEHAINSLLQPNGIVVYATCSLLKRESEDQVSKLLDKHSTQVELVPFEVGEIAGVTAEQISEEGYIRILPSPVRDFDSQELNGDGFFVARLRKLGK